MYTILFKFWLLLLLLLTLALVLVFISFILLLLFSLVFIFKVEFKFVFWFLVSINDILVLLKEDFFLKNASVIFINLLLFIRLFILKDPGFSLISLSGESVFLFFFKKLVISLSFLSSSFKSLFFPILKSIFSIGFCSNKSLGYGLKYEYILLKCVFNSLHSDKFIQAFDKIISSSIIFLRLSFGSSMLFIVLEFCSP